MEALLVIIFFAIAAWIYSFLQSGLKKQQSSNITLTNTNHSESRITKEHIITTSDTLYRWEPTDYHEFEIVGESHYQAALQRLAGDHDGQGEAIVCTAILTPEDHNQYDNKAIRVDINGLTVGYFSRDDARSFRRRLGAKKLTGQATLCNALIKGGHTMKNGEYANYGVSLALKPFNDY